MQRWQVGEIITRREILGFEPTGTTDPTAPWFGESWLDLSAHVVRDSPDELVLYIAPGARFAFPDNDWPIPGGLHPWHQRAGWEGHGCLMWHRPDTHHAVWHFWDGPDRSFACWYINLQTAYRRTAATFDTQDLELDFVVYPDRSWQVKDWDAVDDCVEQGRYSAELGRWIHRYGNSLIERLRRDEWWWDQSWASWEPPPEWETAQAG